MPLNDGITKGNFVLFPYNPHIELGGVVESIDNNIAKIVWPDLNWDYGIRLAIEYIPIEELQKITDQFHIDHISNLLETKGYAS